MQIHLKTIINHVMPAAFALLLMISFQRLEALPFDSEEKMPTPRSMTAMRRPELF